MKVIYTAGAFRASDGWQLAKNVRRAEGVAYEIARLGAVPLCVHTMFHTFDRTQTDQFWLDGTMELMRRCDAVFVVPGWEKSSGTKAEIKEAEKLGLPVFFNMDEVVTWLWDSEAGTPHRGG